MNSKALPFSIHGRLSDFFRIMAAEILKILYRLQTVTFKLSWERKPKKKKVEPGVTYSVALVMVFLAAENESQRLIDLPQADFGCVPERFLFLFIFFCR